MPQYRVNKSRWAIHLAPSTKTVYTFEPPNKTLFTFDSPKKLLYTFNSPNEILYTFECPNRENGEVRVCPALPGDNDLLSHRNKTCWFFATLLLFLKFFIWNEKRIPSQTHLLCQNLLHDAPVILSQKRHPSLFQENRHIVWCPMSYPPPAYFCII